MANPPSKDGPITVIVTMKIKHESAARALELFDEQIIDIHATEPPGNIQYSYFRDNKAENEYTVVATSVQVACPSGCLSLIAWCSFASDAIREAFRTKPKHEEINGKLFSEGLIDGEPKAWFCTEVAGTRI